jgi:hypothetical protein
MYVTVVYDLHKFNNFQYTKVTNSGEKPYRDLPEPDGFTVRQYVLRVDLTGQDEPDFLLGYDTFILESQDDTVRRELGLI